VCFPSHTHTHTHTHTHPHKGLTRQTGTHIHTAQVHTYTQHSTGTHIHTAQVHTDTHARTNTHTHTRSDTQAQSFRLHLTSKRFPEQSRTSKEELHPVFACVPACVFV